MRVFDWLDGPSIIIYSVTYTVSNAHADEDTVSVPLPLMGSGSSAYVQFGGWVEHFGSDAYAGFSHELAGSVWEPSSGTFTRRMVLTSEDGSPLHGPVGIGFDLWLWASMEPTMSGSVDVGATVDITSVTSQVIS